MYNSYGKCLQLKCYLVWMASLTQASLPPWKPLGGILQGTSGPLHGRKAISLVLWTLSDSAILVLYLKVRVYPGLLDASSTPQCLHVVGSLPSHQNIYDAAALCCKDCRHFWLHVLKIALNLRNLSLGCEDCPQSWEPNVMY